MRATACIGTEFVGRERTLKISGGNGYLSLIGEIKNKTPGDNADWLVGRKQITVSMYASVGGAAPRLKSGRTRP